MIKVGEYVRTQNGIIGKIKHINDDMFEFEDNNRTYIDYKSQNFYNSKFSKIIINLIEVRRFCKWRESCRKR